MTEKDKMFLKELLKKLPTKFWEDDDHAVGGYISKKDLFKILADSQPLTHIKDGDMKTLLDRARGLKKKSCGRDNFSDEEIQLCAAYLRGEIELYQVRKILSPKKGGELVYSYIARAVRQAFLEGKLKKLI